MTLDYTLALTAGQISYVPFQTKNDRLGLGALSACNNPLKTAIIIEKNLLVTF